MVSHRNVVFVSYSREEGSSSNEEVLSFVNLLRQLGYDARVDELLLGDTPSLNLYRMMAEQIAVSNKVIIIFSESYKKKADAYLGGVGFEVEKVMPDFRENPRKYIFLAFCEEQGLTDSHIKRIQPFAFIGCKIYPMNGTASAINRLASMLTGVPERRFSDVAPELVLPEGQDITPFAELQREKRTDKFHFRNLHIHTILRFDQDASVASYEVFRCIQVTSVRLPHHQMRPQFAAKGSVKLSSLLVDLPETITLDEKGCAKFVYPTPPANKFGDVLQMHYKLELECSSADNTAYFTLSENDSQMEIHDIVLEYKESAPDAKLSKRGKTDLLETFVQSVPFDAATRMYRFILVNPEVECTYTLRW